MRVPASQFKFKKPDFWRSVDTEYAKNPRWDVNNFIVANAAGLQYMDRDLLVTKLREAFLEIGGHELTPTLPEGRQDLDIPTCFTNFSGLSEPPLPSSSWSDSDEALEFTHYESLDPRWVNAASIWYTDGSAVKTKDDGTIIGSGAYCRSGEVKLRIAPCGDGPTNTIMRAELVAIYAVLYHLRSSHSECIIATDSKASMQVIHKQIHNPSGNQLSTHRVLLEALTAMHDACTCTSFCWRAPSKYHARPGAAHL